MRAVVLLVLLGTACTAFAASSRGEYKGMWVNLFQPPYTNVPTVTMAISCTTHNDCYVPGGENGRGFDVFRFDGRPNGQFTPLSMPSPALMIMAIGMGGTPEEPHGCVGGVGIGNGIQYAVNSTTFLPSILPSLMVETQNIRTTLDGTKVLVVDGNNALVSTSKGVFFEKHTINSPHPKEARGRYGAMIDENTMYLTMGSWPDSQVGDISARWHWGKRNGVRAPVSRSMMDSVLKGGNNTMYTAAIVKTTDGGKTWTTLFQDESSYYFNAIDCSSATHCVAVAEGHRQNPAIHIFVTTDGLSFKEVMTLPSTSKKVYSIMSCDFSSPNEVWVAGAVETASGSHALFFDSKDAGLTWSEANELEDIEDVMDVAFTPDGTGFATAITIYRDSTILRYVPLTK